MEVLPREINKNQWNSFFTDLNKKCLLFHFNKSYTSEKISRNFSI